MKSDEQVMAMIKEIADKAGVLRLDDEEAGELLLAEIKKLPDRDQALELLKRMGARKLALDAIAEIAERN
jgi:hypothetical protein